MSQMATSKRSYPFPHRTSYGSGSATKLEDLADSARMEQGDRSSTAGLISTQDLSGVATPVRSIR